MKSPCRCPVCEGRGTVPNGFYFGGGYSTSTTPETCRSCNGKGYILVEGNTVPKGCFNCSLNDGLCYTSSPCQYRCTKTDKYHLGGFYCDDWKPQSL